MRFYASFSLAFGLVAASPCKPLTSGSTAVSATFSSSATEISSTFTESATSTTESVTTETSVVTESETLSSIDSTATEASTIAGSTSTEFTDVTITATETSSQATSDTTLLTSTTFADTTTTIASTETSIVESSTAQTTTAMTTTTTSEQAGPTDHFLIAGEGPAHGLPLKSNTNPGTFLIFGERTSSWKASRFIIEPSSGYLTQDGIPVCASHRVNSKNAFLTLCPTESYHYGLARLTCVQNPAPGTAIQCSARKLNCTPSGPGDSQTCVISNEASWSKFFISTTSDYTWYLGADDFQSDYYTSLDVFVDMAPIDM